MKSRIYTLLSLPLLISFLTSPTLAASTVWLSSLDLSHATQGFGKPQADKSVDGHTLTLNGQTFAHGFGTHSPGLLAIDLGGTATRFTATVGIDDEVGGGRGSAEFEVLTDGGHKILWRSGILRQGQPPKTLDVDLAGVKQILLRVTTGGDDFNLRPCRLGRCAVCRHWRSTENNCLADEGDGAAHGDDGSAPVRATNPSAVRGRCPARHAVPLDDSGDGGKVR